ncbi:hypothetical protein AFM11_05240 [Mycolicibacterium wolinskyi]|uniref:AAA family ATPase n=1 Tax=Mycolicibacterium wolinskyi TaxID=59750 RepID=A0A132PTH1_9MYCO|nr:AAA family ATPase [Mycolicibacterium wolinskyi]KWX25631.1 hypothetical protein AFM11_05240 [Mycolicibacterium wolinskyi]
MKSNNDPRNEAQSPEANAEHGSSHNGFVIDLPVDYGKRAKAHDGRVDVNGLRPGDEGYQPFNRPSVNAKVAEETAMSAALEKRRSRWAKVRFARASLDGRTEAWARRLAAEIDTWDAGRDPTRDAPQLTFKGDRLVNAGASDDQIESIGALTNEQIATLKITAAATREACRATVKRKAASMATPRRPLAEVIRHVADMASDPPTRTIVDGLIYEQTVTHWIGDGGTYKTFTVMSLACSVAAGRDFTHQLKVPDKLPVLYLCAERRHYGLGADVHAWCRTNDLDISDLLMSGWDDVVQLADDEWMGELIEYVKARGIKLIIFDTQRKATKGIEENSSTDIGAALANAQKLAMAASAAVIVIHHTARDKDHARGTSAARDDTDATVVQTVTGPNEAEFRIDKHKSEATGTRYPIKVATVTGTVPPSGDRVGYSYKTLVVSARDPMSMDETAARVHAALSYDDKILVEVVNDNDGPALSPAEVERRATARGCGLKKDAVARHLHQLAKPGYGQIAETVSPVSNRKTYGPKMAALPEAGETPPVAAEADVVDLATRPDEARAKPSAKRRPRGSRSDRDGD